MLQHSHIAMYKDVVHFDKGQTAFTHGFMYKDVVQLSKGRIAERLVIDKSTGGPRGIISSTIDR